MLLRAHALKFHFVTPISDICNAGELAEWSGVEWSGVEGVVSQ